MNKAKTVVAVDAARRFIQQAELVLAAEAKYQASPKRSYEYEGKTHVVPTGNNPFSGSRVTGSMRRASLDLTQALAQLRKSG